jgi:drug/metabolite transporter (DMT)-like permease
MKKGKEATFWAILIVLFAMLYIFSSFIFIHTVTDVIGIPWLDEIISAIFFFMTCGLVVYGYWHPDFLFTQKADKKRVLLIKRIWFATRGFSEESIDDIEKKISDIFYSF